MAKTQDWTELTRFALSLAEASAKAILPYFRRNTPIEVKQGPIWDPVTEGDKVEAQRRLGYSVNGYGMGDLVKRVKEIAVGTLPGKIEMESNGVEQRIEELCSKASIDY